MKDKYIVEYILGGELKLAGPYGKMESAVAFADFIVYSEAAVVYQNGEAVYHALPWLRPDTWGPKPLKG